jgi:hypothetical protein
MAATAGNIRKHGLLRHHLLLQMTMLASTMALEHITAHIIHYFT